MSHETDPTFGNIEHPNFFKICFTVIVPDDLEGDVWRDGWLCLVLIEK
jgi:hypothetical protein